MGYGKWATVKPKKQKKPRRKVRGADFKKLKRKKNGKKKA